ncbi:hypothetical protein FDG2_5400 [Candidatus Protofrankia californiensis]|uniref:Uncharacterized protein n=1 Tax=Candidatus Protofrankia californiensis TaxID=1839754 RepID=A0A1C3PCY2_9ACTN|nr:hypothetical protein FDG2_5400 [Candidatus Protofrankia californiensis]
MPPCRRTDRPATGRTSQQPEDSSNPKTWAQTSDHERAGAGPGKRSAHLRTKFSRSPLGCDQEYVTCVVRPGVCPARNISRRV